MTLLLTARDVRTLLTPSACAEAVEAALRRQADGHTYGPASLAVPVREGGFHVKAAALADGAGRMFAAKINGNFPGNPDRSGRPTIQGLIVLCEAGDGTPLAVLDSAEITALRTAATTAVAARHLAPPGASRAAVIGCGVLGAAQVQALCAALPLAEVALLDVVPGRAEALAGRLGGAVAARLVPVQELAAVGASDVVVTCTTARQAFLRPQHVRPGALVAAVGADNPQKQELDPQVMAGAAVVADSLEQCAAYGELRHALAAGVLRREDVRGELAEVVVGRRTARVSPAQTVVFDSTGTALQDVAAAVVVYRAALAAGMGVSVAFRD